MALSFVAIFFMLLSSMVVTAVFPQDSSVVGYSPDDLLSIRGISNLFESWIRKHGKNYTSNEEKLNRYEIFKTNLRHVDETNKVVRSYSLGLNKFADISKDEFKKQYLGGLKVGKLNKKRYIGSADQEFKQTETLPDSVDWRNGGVVTPVKYHDVTCDSACWAFAAVAAVEGINAIVTGELTALSEQQIIDCDPSNHRCEGAGNFRSAFDYIVKNGGLASEEAYPYLNTDNQECNVGIAHKAPLVRIDDYKNVDAEANEINFLRALAQQPLSVGIDFSELQLYTKGIFYGECGTDLNYAVTAVGYGTIPNDSIDYFIMKNSFGPEWGENGFMRIMRNTGIPQGQCGINKMVSYPIKNS